MKQSNSCLKYKDHPTRKLTLDALKLSKKKRIVTSISEVDITEVRKTLKTLRREKKINLSLYSYALFCIGRAYNDFPRMAAVKGLGNRYYAPGKLSAMLPTIYEHGGEELLLPQYIREFNFKSPFEIQNEIEQFKPGKQMDSNELKFFLKFPQFLRMAYYNTLRYFPVIHDKIMGSTLVVNNMLFTADAWNNGIPFHTSAVFLGSTSQKVVKIRGEFVERTFLKLTVSADHIVVDGADVAGFMNQVKKNISVLYKGLDKHINDINLNNG